jgi:hypothetical protein
MKNLILVIGSLLVIQNATCQNFVSEDKRWNVRDLFWGQISTEIFKMEGDTIINSNTYKKVWSTYDSTLINWILRGFVREDANVVYFKGEFTSIEGILYDFNLEAGDTAYVTNMYCDVIQIVINSIDTVTYFDIPRKRWVIDAWIEEYWVEGIGSLYGPFHTKFAECITDNDFSLLCFYQNDTLRYMKPDEDECYQSSVGIEEPDAGHFIIKPNPIMQGQSFEILTDKKIKEVNIYNAGGALAICFIPESERNLLIRTDQLKTGLYLVRMVAIDNQVYSQKIIVR